ncbi:membrane steroid-binding protein 2-like [Alnus glutinosa]|uniref:membrane steroid-binding protein 2-like n=1 Tax=Alnus glutinosa TaxID=3517 RepID=UPI002D77A474|nr:membrane steroid-binding protein 2-like [Alnus glutinosa]
MALYTTVMEEITGYTGLSPAALFTIVALMAVVYKTVCGMFVAPEDFNKPPVVTANFNSNILNMTNSSNTKDAQPLQLGEVTEHQLKAYDGSDPNKPILMAIKGQIYDVSSSRMFYGRGGPYAMFAGRDASRALALLSFKPQDLNGNLQGLDASELEILQDWEDKFMEKYVKVGHLACPTTNDSGS